MESVLKENIGQISAKIPAAYLVEQALTFTQMSYSDISIPQTLISVLMIQLQHLSLCPVAEKRKCKNS
jgi:hypothetical protein